MNLERMTVEKFVSAQKSRGDRYWGRGRLVRLGAHGRGPAIPAGSARRRPSGAHPGAHTGADETSALPVGTGTGETPARPGYPETSAR